MPIRAMGFSLAVPPGSPSDNYSAFQPFVKFFLVLTAPFLLSDQGIQLTLKLCKSLWEHYLLSILPFSGESHPSLSSYSPVTTV